MHGLIKMKGNLLPSILCGDSDKIIVCHKHLVIFIQIVKRVLANLVATRECALTSRSLCNEKEHYDNVCASYS